MATQGKHLCIICGKKYSSRQSLHNHKKRMHSNEKVSLTPKSTFSPHFSTTITPLSEHTLKKLTCIYCNKVFSRVDSLTRHQKTSKKCKANQEETDFISKEEHQRILKDELSKIKQELTEQFMKILSNNHSQHITNQLNDNATQNNITIVSLGKEDVLGTLTQKEKLSILNERYKSVLELVKLLHCSGKYPQFNNSIISNLKSEFALTYNEKDSKFVTTKKSELVSNIVSHRTANVEEILDENKNKVSKQTNKKVKELIEILEKDDLNLTVEDDEFIKDYKTNVMTSIYDNRDELKQTIKILK